ncbi:MAG: hypothetical protein ACHQFW_07850 [Chitinophagales bacterium]
MEDNTPNHEEEVTQVYNFAANMLIHEKKDPHEVRSSLVEKGLDEKSAAIVVEQLEKQIKDARFDRAKKDMLYGALWCVGGIIATVANIGFIFWGAIVFGAVQFIKGVANSLSN